MDQANAAMDKLQKAINDRIEKENLFISTMTAKFREIAEKIQSEISGKQEYEQFLTPHIEALNEASNQLETQGPLANVQDAILNLEADGQPAVGGRRRSKRRRKRRQTKRK